MNELQHQLKQWTPARVGIGHYGSGIPTKEVLNFRLAHAQARDAVLIPADFTRLTKSLKDLEMSSHQLSSSCKDRSEFIENPDKGRQLNEESKATLGLLKNDLSEPLDLALVLCDGLSSTAVETWAVECIHLFRKYARERGWRLSPILLAQNGRVALGDEIGEILQVQMSIVFIGERPGLGSADSLGIYLTHSPKKGTTDEARNCISNIRASGLSPQAAAFKLSWLVAEALRRGLSGTSLKDESEHDLNEIMDSSID